MKMYSKLGGIWECPRCWDTEFKVVGWLYGEHRVVCSKCGRVLRKASGKDINRWKEQT